MKKTTSHPYRHEVNAHDRKQKVVKPSLDDEGAIMSDGIDGEEVIDGEQEVDNMNHLKSMKIVAPRGQTLQQKVEHMNNEAAKVTGISLSDEKVYTNRI